MEIKISQELAGQRLDKFLTDYQEQILGFSRNQAQKMIKAGIILLNGQTAASHQKLKPGDLVKITGRPEEIASLRQPDKITAIEPDIQLIDQTADYLVINKPSGLAAHGQAGYTLADWLVKKYPAIKKIGDDPERPGIVHRLDKDVSGLMVIAKTQDAFDCLKKQFQRRTVKKEYTALACGQIKKEHGLINFPIKRAKEGYKMAAIPATLKGRPSENGRPAETEFQITKKFINYTLLKIKIKTGRTHQIRVHLSAYGHPLLGDNIYGTAKTRLINKKLNTQRVFLVADRLSFKDLSGEEHSFTLNLPPELKNILKKVK